MAKSAFTNDEMKIWNSIYGPSRGPTLGRLKILVEDLEARGLAPVMMRIGDDMRVYDAASFQVAIREACQNKDDDGVQVYYHPQECECVVGSTATTWTHWGRLILNIVGLVPSDAGDDHPVIMENVPRLRLPTEVRTILVGRGLTTSPVCRLVSARIAAFFIAAQYEAWATPAQVSQVAPFKKILQRQGFQVREVIVRKDDGLDAVLSSLDVKPEISTQEPIMPTVVVTTDGMDVHPCVESDILEESWGGSKVDDIDAEIARVQAQLLTLQQRKSAVLADAVRQAYLSAVVSDVALDQSLRPTGIVLRFHDGTDCRLRVLVIADHTEILRGVLTTGPATT